MIPDLVIEVNMNPFAPASRPPPSFGSRTNEERNEYTQDGRDAAIFKGCLMINI